MYRENPQRDYPHIDNTAYIDPTAVIIGRVVIGKNVFVGPGAVIRADEPESSITVEDNCNVQDRVIIHALENSFVLIEENTSLAHGCIVHGPCKIGKYCFVGFGSVVFNAEICKGVVIKHLSCIEGVKILPEKLVESCTLVNSEDDGKRLGFTDKEIKSFVEKVVLANLLLAKGYKNGKSNIFR
ncbi:MAG: carbonate dehydratase [bacterium]